MYVKSIDVPNNTVTLAEEQELFSDTLTADEFNWISGRAPSAEVRCRAKIRYRHPEQDAAAYPLPDGRVKVVFDRPQRAVTPGQAVVLYDGDIVLGGGRILK
jgi:tRNA-specific 2-thiouridylase